MNILLMGPRGCGKSTIGRALAAAMDRRFIDLDEHVLRSFTERSVREVWSRRGEPAWRAAEAAALDEVLGRTDQVVALGGGTPTIERARRRMEQERREGRAVVVYLRCDPRELARRLAAEADDRPPLSAPDDLILQQREPVYRALADLDLDVSGSSPEHAVEALQARLLANRFE
jgi:shikimate kinase